MALLLLLLIPFVISVPTLRTPHPDPWSIYQASVPETLLITPDYNIPTVDDAPEIPYEERDSPTHAYSVDVAFHTTPSDMDCLREKGYKSVFARAFNPVGDGYFDRDVLNTITNAYESGLGCEVYITPKINSSRSAADQVSLVYETLHDNGVGVRSMWIQVTSPTNWEGTIPERIEFIQEMVRTVRDYGMIVGIYTSFYDWLEITGGWGALSSEVLLWYWHVLGVGADGESDATFEDFREFGPWRNAAVKQFGQVEKVCGMIVNRNVYPRRSQTAPRSQLASAQKILVGSIGF